MIIVVKRCYSSVFLTGLGWVLRVSGMSADSLITKFLSSSRSAAVAFSFCCKALSTLQAERSGRFMCVTVLRNAATSCCAPQPCSALATHKICQNVPGLVQQCSATRQGHEVTFPDMLKDLTRFLPCADGRAQYHSGTTVIAKAAHCPSDRVKFKNNTVLGPLPVWQGQKLFLALSAGRRA